MATQFSDMPVYSAYPYDYKGEYKITGGYLKKFGVPSAGHLVLFDTKTDYVLDAANTEDGSYEFFGLTNEKALCVIGFEHDGFPVGITADITYARIE